MAIFNSQTIGESFQIPNYLESIQESVHEGISLKGLSIQIVAETAYNDVIMESYVQSIFENATILNEGFVDKIKTIFDKLIGMIKQFWGKN